MQAFLSTQSRLFGSSAVRVPLLGFGAAPIGNLYQAVSDAGALDAVARARALGMDYFDTAPHYGFGLSETRLGQALRDHRSAIVISTKVGRLLVPTNSRVPVRFGFAETPALEPVFNYSYDAVMRSFESSLKRLRCERVDILFAHDLGEATHGKEHCMRWREFIEGGYRAMQELRAGGLVAAIGLGANEWQVCEQALSYGDFDGFLLAGRYTLLEQGACDSFLPLCARRGVSVILGGPFNSGILATGVTGPGPFHYDYEPASAGIIARVQRLESLCREFALPLAAAALQFPAAHPQICSVIAGFANAAQVEQAVKLMNSPLPGEFWQALRDQDLIHPEAPVPAITPFLT